MRRLWWPCLWLGLIACQSAPQVRGQLEQPTLPDEKLEVLSQTLTDCAVKYSGTLASPEVELQLQKAVIEFVVDGVVLNTREQTLAVTVPAGGTHAFEFEETYTYVKDLEALTALDDRGGSMLLALRGVLVGSLQTPQGPQPVQLPFAKSKALRTPRLPKVKVIDLEAGRFSQSEVQVTFHVGVVNPNPFEILMTGLTYQAVLANKKIAESFVGKGERVAAASTGVFDVAVTMNEETYGPEVKAVIKSLVVPYVLTGTLSTSLTRAPLDARGEIRLRSSN
jgi:hypothetical protein